MKSAILTAALAVNSLLAQVPVEQEPDHHAGFHNEHLYLLEPMFPPGHTTLEHQHRYDGVTVCIQGSMMRAKPSGGEWGEARQLCQPGGVNVTENTGRPSSHTVQNVGNQTTHLRLIENLREGAWTTFGPVTAAGLKVTRESRAFRSYQVEQGSAAHAHPVPAVVVLVSGQARTGGQEMTRPGTAAYVPAAQLHAVEGAGHVVEVEVR